MLKNFHKILLVLAYVSVADAKLYALDTPVPAQEVVSVQKRTSNFSDSTKKNRRRKKSKKYQKMMAAAGVLLVGGYMVHNIFETEPDHKNTENPEDFSEVDNEDNKSSLVHTNDASDSDYDDTKGAFAQAELRSPPTMSSENVTSTKSSLRYKDDTLAPGKAREVIVQRISEHGVKLLRAGQLIPADLVRAKRFERLQAELDELDTSKPCFLDFLYDCDDECVEFMRLTLSHCAMRNFKPQAQEIKSLVQQDAEYRLLSEHDPNAYALISCIENNAAWIKEIRKKYFEYLTLTRFPSIPITASSFIGDPYPVEFAEASYRISDGLLEIYFPSAKDWIGLQPHRVIDPGRRKAILAKIALFIPQEHNVLEHDMHLIGCNHNFAVFLINNDQYACELPATITEKPKIWRVLSEQWQEININEEHWRAYQDSCANKHTQQMHDEKAQSLLNFRVCHPVDNFLGVEEYAMEIKSVGEQDARSIWSNWDDMHTALGSLHTDGADIGRIPVLAADQKQGYVSQCTVFAVPGTGALYIAGRKKMTRASIWNGLTFLQSHVAQLGLDQKMFNTQDLFIGMDDQTGDGPSAGMAFTTAIFSALTKNPIKRGYAVTGTIDVLGHVGAVGCIANKAIAAGSVSIPTVLYPAEQTILTDMHPTTCSCCGALGKDTLDKLREHKVSLIPVHDATQVFQIMLSRGVPPIQQA